MFNKKQHYKLAIPMGNRTDQSIDQHDRLLKVNIIIARACTRKQVCLHRSKCQMKLVYIVHVHWCFVYDFVTYVWPERVPWQMMIRLPPIIPALFIIKTV